ncbi:MAG: right-handed parallel beta-helix repeat-containing protein [Gemmatimonadales bacterium]|jgi:parallel beta-helix repeat protein|nr:right-handed parallel beta-helix repeat-containing protein [Gemmatimonadales bacterium]
MIATLALLSTLAAAAPLRAAPCIRLLKPGTVLRGDTRVCPGKYRVTDAREQGVLVVAVSGIRLDLSGVVLESGDSIPANFAGVGVVSRGVDSLTVTGGTIRGYRFGIRISGGKGHEVRGSVLSGSRNQALQSADSTYAVADELDIFRPEAVEGYGAGLLLEDVDGAVVAEVTAERAQNGIVLHRVRRAIVADNVVSRNSGWGISLWRAAQNTIVRNRAEWNVRCVGRTYRRGCQAAALLLRDASDSNLVADNDLRHSGTGFLLSGHRPGLAPSNGNLVLRNDATGAYRSAFVATFSWGNRFIDNRADSAEYGFRLSHSSGTVVRGSTALGTRVAAIAVEHGSDDDLSANVIIGGRDGIVLSAPQDGGPASRGHLVSDNVLARLARGVVLERSAAVKLRGNLFDGDEDALVSDAAASDAEVQGNVFLRSTGFFVRAAELDAGGNYWGASDPEATREKLAGRVLLTPWYPASQAGF